MGFDKREGNAKPLEVERGRVGSTVMEGLGGGYGGDRG